MGSVSGTCSFTRRLVNEYLGTGNMDVKEAILDFQWNIRKKQADKKRRDELEGIDAVMNEVPELPKNFEKWIIRNCFIEQVMYQKQGKAYKTYCTACGKEETVKERPVHGKRIYCSRCKRFWTARAWRKQKYLTDAQDVGILQRLNDGSGYILRNFDCRKKLVREKEWKEPEVFIHENVRMRLTPEFAEAEAFEWGEYKNTGVTRWCHTIRGGMAGYYYHNYFGQALMYTPNLKRELKGERFAYMDWKRWMRSGQRERVSPSWILQRLYRYPCIEYMEKIGLSRLVDEIMAGKEISKLLIPQGDFRR